VTKRQKSVRTLAVLSLAFGGVLIASTSMPAFASPTVSGTSAGTLLVPASIDPVIISAGSGPDDVVVASDSGTAYMTDTAGNRVLAFNASTGTSTPTSLIGSAPKGIAISPSGGVVYVADYTSGIIELVDTATNALLPGHITLGVSSSPLHMAVSPDGSRVYVDEQGTDLLEAYSTTSPYPFLGAATTGVAPTGVAISADGSKVYVAGGGGVTEGYVDVVDTASLNTTTNVTPTVIPIPPAAVPFAGTFAVAASPDGSTLYVANVSAFTFQAIPTSTDVPGPPISLPSPPDGIAVSPDGKLVYISGLSGDLDVASTSDLAGFATFNESGNL
jgi:DNA-binding beta-propeller fold protein YncE